MNKKAQLQIMENAFAMIIIFIIFIIVGVFAFAVIKNDQVQKEKEFAELEVLKKSWILNFLPEMQCSDNLVIDADCYDLLKINAFTKRLEEDPASGDYYRSLLGYVNISVEWIDPSPDINRVVDKWQIYDNPPPTKGDKNNTRPVRNIPLPITLKDPVNGSEYTYLGVVYLGAYE